MCHCEYNLAFAMILKVSIKFGIYIDIKLHSLTFKTNLLLNLRLLLVEIKRKLFTNLNILPFLN